MKTTGILITLEGIDGCGKSTQARLLARALRRAGRDVLLTRQPGGTTLGRRLRRIVLHSTSKISPPAELFLYLADRAQHVEEAVLPALDAGKIVISERFADSTLVYQGAGRGLPAEQLAALNRIATGGLAPHLTILLDLPPAEARARREQNGLVADRFERLDGAFHARLARGYRSLAAHEPERVKVVRAVGPAEEVHGKVMEVLRGAGILGRGEGRRTR